MKIHTLNSWNTIEDSEIGKLAIKGATVFVGILYEQNPHMISQEKIKVLVDLKPQVLAVSVIKFLFYKVWNVSEQEIDKASIETHFISLYYMYFIICAIF